MFILITASEWRLCLSTRCYHDATRLEKLPEAFANVLFAEACELLPSFIDKCDGPLWGAHIDEHNPLTAIQFSHYKWQGLLLEQK